MATWTNDNPTYYINPATLTFNENSGYGANFIQVSASSSCYIFVYDPDNGIGYSDADKNYKKWKVTAYNNKFPHDKTKYLDKWYIYVRLERNGAAALIIYDQVERGVHGGEIIKETDESGNEVKTEGEYDEEFDYYYIHIGEVGATDGTSIRDISYDTGYLTSDRGKVDSDALSSMWELDKSSTRWLIKAKHWLKDFTVKGFVKLIGGFIFKKDSTEKRITDIVRTSDYKPNDLDISDEELISDETLPTTRYVEDNFLNTKKEDTVEQIVTWLKGLKSGTFEPGELGAGFILKDENGRSYMELDELLVRKVAYFMELNIKKIKHVGGTLILTPASMKCVQVVEENDSYRCHFLAEDDGQRVENEFRVGDMARSQSFDVSEGVSQNVKSQYYWRLVVGVGEDYILLSKSDCDMSGSDTYGGTYGVPQVGDEIVQLGNKGYLYAEDPSEQVPNPDRQNAIILSTVGDDAPSLKQYTNIHSYNMAEATLVTVLSPKGNMITSQVYVDNGEGGSDDIGEALKDIKYDYEKVMNQLDKEFTMCFYPWVPTMDNEPASSWMTEKDKVLHEEDLFYCTNEDDKDSYGKVWRFVLLESGEYGWSEVTDKATIAAMEKAAAAQETADVATDQIDKITSDEWLSPDEKKEVRREWEEITLCRDGHLEMASSIFGIGLDENKDIDGYRELESYNNAYLSLGNYMYGPLSGEDDPGWQEGDIPKLIRRADETEGVGGLTLEPGLMDEYTEIFPEEYRSYWTGYYDRERRLQNKFADLARKVGQNALDELDKIASDGWLTMDEKKEVLLEWKTITSRFKKFTEVAESYSLSSSDEYLAYSDAYNALGTYLNQNDREDGEEEWDGTSIPFILEEQANQQIDRAEYMSKWKLFYDAEVDFQNALADTLDNRINGRVKAFVDTPTPPYNVGDRWSNVYWKMNASDDEYFYQNADLVCWNAKEEGQTFDINDWRPLVDVALSYIGTSENEVGLYARWFGFDEGSGVTIKQTSGLVSEANFTTLFAKAVTSDGEAKEALLTVAVTKDEDGNLESGVKISAGNISINGIAESKKHTNSVVVGGFEIYGNQLEGGEADGRMKLVLSDSRSSHPSISWSDSDRDYAWVGMFDLSGYKSGQIYLFDKEQKSMLILPDKIAFNGFSCSLDLTCSDTYSYAKWASPSGSLGTAETRIGVLAYDGKDGVTTSEFVIYSSVWPTVKSALSGYVYKDSDGYLRVS